MKRTFKLGPLQNSLIHLFFPPNSFIFSNSFHLVFEISITFIMNTLKTEDDLQHRVAKESSELREVQKDFE